jgi:hypothetical protein
LPFIEEPLLATVISSDAVVRELVEYEPDVGISRGLAVLSISR